MTPAFHRLARHAAPMALALSLALTAAAHAETVADPLAATGKWSAYSEGRAATPPMGWSSWNAFGTDLTEARVLDSARIIVESGLAAKGYRYINIDDGWWLKRRQSDGRMQIRTKLFPSAAVGGPEETSFRPFTDRIHQMGLKAGIYSDLGRNACSQAYGGPKTPNLPEGTVQEREVGLYGHIEQDIPLYFKEWGFDFIKVDGCGVRAFGADSERVKAGTYRELPPLIDFQSISRTNIPAVKALYKQIGASLKASNPDGDYVFSLCAWGSADVRAWGKDVGNLSRTSDDLTPSWSRMLSNFDSAATRALYAHPGSWNDPDMLFIGHGEFDAQHLVQARSHFALWAMINAPLLIGYDLKQATPELMQIFGNEALIALNQDAGGHQAVLAYDSDDIQILIKTVGADPTRKAVALFNRTAEGKEVILTAEHLKYLANQPVTLRDLWTQADQTPFTGEAKFHLEPHQTLIFMASGTPVLNNGQYLSDLPGRVNPAVDGVVVPQADPFIYRMKNPWSGTRGRGDIPAYTGWGGAQADASPYGRPLQIGGKPFRSGIGILANSRLEVRVQPTERRFEAKVGVDDSTLNTTEAVTFAVYGDGKLLTKSQPLRFGQAPQALAADLKGVRLVELVATSAGKNAHPVAVTWGDAALLK
ncbi:NPCBM/NEW2 domain-containing protein [Asticcacaulis excentricus]|uniref:Alpha-galactosidase n=1 Tax=Asticcacaulis excentricus TaxID=78587 RepID=A0A3G9GB61_9CAUL|nr:NPCBM/NEW2 domain-containing protein [Asticcacaulis excentricus]BBF81738.1 alpha-galactosidase precursor [Asticcacaulis excentricus]